jgi:hypothetical protein
MAFSYNEKARPVLGGASLLLSVGAALEIGEGNRRVLHAKVHFGAAILDQKSD